MYLPKLREIREALGSFFSAPYTTKYPFEPYTPPEEYRGFPEYNDEECVGCGACAQVCPSSAIEVIDDTEQLIRTLRIDYTSCIQCGQCHEHCIIGEGIDNTGAYSLPVSSTMASDIFHTVEKDLVVCENCGGPIATRDHLSFVKERLGAKAYAHPSLLLNTQREYSDVILEMTKERLRREDYFKQVCAKCRQQISVLDEFYAI